MTSIDMARSELLRRARRLLGEEAVRVDDVALARWRGEADVLISDIDESLRPRSGDPTI